MPELPEVETVANGVHDRTHGQTILSVWTSGKSNTFKTSEAQIAETLTGARIDRVHRVGKTIVCDLTLSRNESAQFLIHLGMTGRLLVSPSEIPVPNHTHAILTLNGGQELRFIDARRFGRLSIHQRNPIQQLATKEKSARATIFDSYTGTGCEPLNVSLEDFITLFRDRKTPIKVALLNQSLLQGIGNIYADESLFRAGIRPRRRATRLTRAELTRLWGTIIEVLREAIKLGGSSVSDYVNAEGVRGFFQLQHRVYMRTGKPCLLCFIPIKKITLAGRSTHFCPSCQQ